jgi:uncharacterized protein (DUF2141 family)
MGGGNSFAGTLTVRVENIDPGKGHLMIGLFNDEKTFPDVYHKGLRVPATDGAMIVEFVDLPDGPYAVSVYQDANDNEELDKNFFGIPKERYGFSNDSDRPNYGKCRFDFKNDMTININLK